MRSRINVKTTLDDDNHRWVISYADFMTLLFAFFVVMYAASTINAVKYKVLSESIDKQFKQLQAVSQPRETISHVTEDMTVSPQAPLKDWTELDIQSAALFDSGDAELLPAAKKQLKRIIKRIQLTNDIVAIEGYTDNASISSNRYPNNWALSAARAAAVAAFFVDNGVKEHRLSAIGYGAQYPIASNATRDGREKNRRVVLVISQNQRTKRLLNPAVNEAIQRQMAIDELDRRTKKINIIKEERTQGGGVRFKRETIRVTKE